MKVHTVEEGETLDRIASRYEFPTGASLYDHPANADLRVRRPDPRFIAPGDEVVIPKRASRGTACTTGHRYTFVMRSAEPEVRIRVAYFADAALKGVPYRLTVGDVVHEGMIPDDTVIRHRVPLEATDGELIVTMPDGAVQTWTLRIGYLEPHETDRGLQARLANLAHYHGPLDGAVDSPATRAAIDEFIALASGTLGDTLGATDVPPPDLRERVAKAHGS
jgi:hypothetical protein